MKFKLLLLLLVLFTIAGCTRYQSAPTSITCADGSLLTCPIAEEAKPILIDDEKIEPIEIEPNTTETIGDGMSVVEPEEVTGESGMTEADIEVFEGELVKIEPKVTDADGDEVILTFSEPLDEQGEWQTAEGDAGEYEVTITASDGKSAITKKILLRVKALNSAPEIAIESELTVKEGETVEIDPVVTDADGDNVTVTFTGWMDSSSYETDYTDAGEHVVTIVANDGKTATSKSVTVIVENVNRRPSILVDDEIEVVEGDLAELDLRVRDPDSDDEISFSIDKLFDENGEWQTKEGDAGEYTVTIEASDGTVTVSKEVLVKVLRANRPPFIEDINPIYMNVGDNLKDYLEVEALDPEGEEVIITYSGWVNDIDYVATEDDAGNQTIVITYSDGVNELQQEVNVHVNRPPIFEI